jgi:D-3-phosphoglycerate dehydrogenase
MNIVILDDYQDAVRKLRAAAKLEAYPAKVYTNTVKGIGQLSVRLRDADVIVLIRERTHMTRQLLEKLPRLKLISQTGKAGGHIDIDACTERGIVVTEGIGSPVAPAELTWALTMAAMRRLPQYIQTLKHGGWQQSGMKSGSMPTNFGVGMALKGRTLGLWGYGKIGQLVAGYGRAFGMRVLGIVRLEDFGRMKTTSLFVNTSRAELVEPDALLAALNRGRPGMAAVDVFESEPILQGHALLRMENCICTPHIGYVEQDSYELYFGAAFDNVVSFIEGNPTNVVNPAALQVRR